MMQNNQPSGGCKNGGISFIGLLTLVFIVLKLCKVIDWSWMWVLSPIWISIVIWILIVSVLIKLSKK